MPKKNAEDNPGREATRELEGAFQKINRSLFGGKLPTPKIDHSVRSDGGSYSPGKMSKSGRRTADKITVNFADLKLATKSGQTEAFARLLHQMVHQWQQWYGKSKCRQTYHNEEWADMMASFGLRCTFDRTRQKITDLEIDRFGSFWFLVHGSGDRKGLLATNPMSWKEVASGKPRLDQMKYWCSGCGASIRGKSGLGILPHPKCGGEFIEVREG